MTGTPGAVRTQFEGWSFTGAVASRRRRAGQAVKLLRMVTPMSWTDERIERLKELWSQGVTASHIAEELGGVSRNAVIGKAHRLGLQSRPSPVKPNEPDAPAPAAVKPKPAAKAAAAAPEPAPKAKAATARQAQPQAEPAAAAPATPSPPPSPQVRSIGPGGFVRQGPSDQQAPIPPAPPRRLVPA